MAEIIRMPRMSDTMEEGNLVGWLKKEGETVEAGETLAEVETDKATMELDSYFDGVLLHIAIKEGTVPINGIIAVIGEKGEDWKAALAAADEGTPSAASPEPAKEAAPAPSAPEQVAANPAPVQNEPAPVASNDSRVKASPLAKSMAKEKGIDLATVDGSGENGRVIKRDIENYKASPASAPASEPAAPSVMPFTMNGTGDNFEDVAVSQMRKVIARRLGESKFGAPHFYLTVEINMGKAVKTRAKLNEISPVKLSYNDLVVKAAAVSLRQHPTINSSWMGDKIRINKNINIGVAVAVEEGLLVPVINHADMKSLSQINVEVKELAGKAKIKKLQPDEMSGNTFTISNLGMFGIEEFTAIINPPDACILAVGGINDKAIVKNGKVVAGKIMKVTLSCDHRVVDGASGAKFLNTFKQILEDPIGMLV